MVWINNSYFLMRSGESNSDKDGVICSKASNCRVLTSEGKRQVSDSVEHYRRLPYGSFIFTSPFLHAKCSAACAGVILRGRYVTVADQLKDRDFGELEGQPVSRCQEVWNNDLNGNRAAHNVEPVESVLERMLSLFRTIKAGHRRESFLLISHTDPLRIFMSYFMKISITEHCRVKPFEFGEIRALRPDTIMQYLLK